jgi:hypothetical protein
MKTRMGFALLILAALGVGTIHGQQEQQTPKNGYWWLPSGEGFKVGFATGYAMAMNDMADAAFFRCVAAKNGGSVPTTYPGDGAIKACMQGPEVASIVTFNGRVGQVAEGVDEFYKDFRNKNILIELAMRYVSDQLKGKPDGELADELADWRQRANK